METYTKYTTNVNKYPVYLFVQTPTLDTRFLKLPLGSNLETLVEIQKSVASQSNYSGVEYGQYN